MNIQDTRFFHDFFKSHIKQFCCDDEFVQKNITLKYNHTLKVCEESKMISEHLNLSKTDKMLAETIALFHDIGRFTQFYNYHTFSDRMSVNHALLGIEILKDTGVLDRLSNGEQKIIYNAIEFHNQFEIPKDIDDSIKLHSKIIRDADKLDIFRVMTEYFEDRNHQINPALEENLPDTQGYNAEIVKDILEGKNTLTKHVKNTNDSRLFKLSWVFDLNFEVTKDAIKKRGYIKNIISTLPDTIEIRQISKKLNAYL